MCNQSRPDSIVAVLPTQFPPLTPEEFSRVWQQMTPFQQALLMAKLWAEEVNHET